MPQATPCQLRPYFDARWYAATYGAGKWRARRQPWRYYRRRGRWKRHSPRQLFAAAWYLSRYPDVRASGLDPLAHYVTHGWHEGRKPHPLFEPAWYLAGHPDVRTSGIEPLLHYITHGWHEGRSPHPAFDAVAYCAAHPEVAAAQLEPLGHYLDRGWRLGYRPHPLFDPAWYLGCHADVAGAGVEPLTHFIDTGWEEHRDPSPEFSLERYVASLGRPVEAGVNPFVHFLTQRGGQAAGTDQPRRPAIRCTTTADTVRHSNAMGPVNRGHIRALALYLPRFYRLPEADAPAGESSLEWNNVARARPMFTGHQQPHVPHPDLGYYDLGDSAVLEQQAALARRHGIHGFCFYHSWFQGRRLRNQLVETLVAGAGPDFPFCLCWDSGSSACEERFTREVLPALRDRRYVAVEGKPLLVVSNPDMLPDPPAAADRWRRIAEQAGLPGLHLATFGESDRAGLPASGFDAVIDMPPLRMTIANLRHSGLPGMTPGFRGTVLDYREAVVHALARPPAAHPLYQGLMPGWDDTPRRLERATAWINSSPELYGRWLRAVVEKTQRELPPERQLVFINAWNDWAAGAHLEPDDRTGYQNLEETAAVLLPAAAQREEISDAVQGCWAVARAIGRAA